MGNHQPNGLHAWSPKKRKESWRRKSNLGTTLSSSVDSVLAVSLSPTELESLHRSPFAFRAVTMAPDHTMVVNMAELRRLLLRRDCVDKPVIVLSIAGLSRKGKSFLLNFFIRYLEANSSGNKNSSKTWLNTDKSRHDFPQWTKEPDNPTNSIYIWSKPYFRYIQGVGEVVVLLVNAQLSTFECPLTAKDCATVFALSTMLSSVQIFNVQGVLDESDLQHLQMFIEYGRTDMSDLRKKPFQHLVFLVRDWSRPYEFPYGFIGGEDYVESLRGSSSSDVFRPRHNDLDQIWGKIDECFQSVSCFLLPHPGTRVATAQRYDGPVRYIDQTFLDHLKSFVPAMVGDDNLTLKTINSNPVTCGKLFSFLKTYAETLQANGLPTVPDTLAASAAHLHYWSLFDAAKNFYEEEMEKIIDKAAEKCITVSQVLEEHDKIANRAIVFLLSDKRPIGDEGLQQNYVGRLGKFTARRIEHYVKLVESINDSAKSNGVYLLLALFSQFWAHFKAALASLPTSMPAFLRNHRYLGAVINTIIIAAIIAAFIAIIAIIGLPVLVSLVVGACLFYFSTWSQSY